MEIFLAICMDRHIDPYIRPFSTFEKAKECCDDFTEDAEELEIQELTDSMKKDNWLYYAEYSCEGDSVRIEKRILDEVR